MDEEKFVNYYSVIPATVRYDKRLKSAEKLLYGEITALSNCYGYCFATNKYFTNLYNVTPHTVSQWLSHLNKLYYIKIDLIKSEDNEIKERQIYILDNPYVQKSTYPYIQNYTYPIDKKVQDNNINNNIDDLYNSIIKKDTKICEEFYKHIERLELVYSIDMLEIMSEKNKETIKNIVFTIFKIYNSSFRNIISKFNRSTIIKIYRECENHTSQDIINYYRKALINNYMDTS